MVSLNALSHYTSQSWIFNVFDEDAGGFIDAVEVEKLVVALLQLTEIEMEQDKIEVCVKVCRRFIKASQAADLSVTQIQIYSVLAAVTRYVWVF